MKNIRKTIFWCVAGAVVAATIVITVRPTPVRVDLGEVTRGSLQVTVDETGETMIREPYLISTPLGGRLLRVELKPGDRIEKGTVLAVIDPAEPGLLDVRTEAQARARAGAAEANLQRVLSELDVAQAEMEKWQRYYARDESRFREERIASASLEDTKHALRVATDHFNSTESAVEVARFELDQAKAALLHSEPGLPEKGGQKYVIHSPIDGVVLRRFVESSAMVAAGQPVLEIGNPGDLEIRIDVLSRDAVKIKQGQRVLIEHWGGKEDLQARVTRVEPSAFTKVSALGVDEKRVFVFADFVSGEAAWAKLGDGYRIEARIVVWEQDEVVKIPASALFRDGDNRAVYVAEGNRARLRCVEAGRHNGIEAEVLDGIEVGERIVLHPGRRLSDNVFIEERDGEARGEDG